MDRAKKTRASKNLSDVRRNLLECMWHFSQKGSPRPTLRKQYHMCRLIYKVLTPGPERISILLGKCFPLGLVSATAYRCSRHAVKPGLFPLNEKKKTKKQNILRLAPARRSYNFCTSALCWALPAALGHGFVRQGDVRWRTSSDRCPSRNHTTPHRTGLSALNALDLCW